MNLKRTASTEEARALIDRFGLQPHPEGGWFSEVYRSDEILDQQGLPERYASPHHISTSIYFLLEQGDFSTFHRLNSDETWHFYAGAAVEIWCIQPDHSLQKIHLGVDFYNDQIPQFTIPRNCWFAARPLEGFPFSLVGCTVAPGFDYSDFEMADKNELLSAFPEYSELILRLTR